MGRGGKWRVASAQSHLSMLARQARPASHASQDPHTLTGMYEDQGPGKGRRASAVAALECQALPIWAQTPSEPDWYHGHMGGG